MVKSFKKSAINIILAIILIAAINYVTQILVTVLKIPLFLDTWGTSLGAMVVNLSSGMLGGILYNLVMAATKWGWSAWVWMFSSIWIAFATWFLYKHGFINIRRPWKVLFAGLIIGFTNALITFEISVLVFNSLPTYAPVAFINDYFLAATGSQTIGSFMQHIIVELVDKTVAIFIAAIVIAKLPINFSNKGKIKKAKPKKLKA